MRDSATSGLPVLPDEWTWHVATQHRGQRIRLALIDASLVARIAFKNENPGQFREGTESYARLVKYGVRVAEVDDLRTRQVPKHARRMADIAWFIYLTRADLVDAHAAADDERTPPTTERVSASQDSGPAAFSGEVG